MRGGGPGCGRKHIYSYPHPCTLPFVNLIHTSMRACPSVWLLIFLVLFVSRQKEQHVHHAKGLFKKLLLQTLGPYWILRVKWILSYIENIEAKCRDGRGAAIAQHVLYTTQKTQISSLAILASALILRNLLSVSVKKKEYQKHLVIFYH